MSRRAGRERGAALLVTMVSVAVLTALAVDLAYESRVSLRIAANARDELRASYLARSGVALSRLVLSFQQKVDGLSSVMGGASKGTGVPSMPRFNLWRMVPVGSGLVAGLFPGGTAPTADAATKDGTKPSTGFDAVIDDEGRKVNAQLDVTVKGGTAAAAASRVLALYQLVCDPRWDPLFDREDARGVRTTREDLLVRLWDWVDPHKTSSALATATSGTASCSMVPGQPPFEDAFGDKNEPYDRGDDRYRVKNARMDSLDELYLVAGVGDAFMAAFGDALTVYLPREAKRNLNEQDRARLVEIAKAVTDPRLRPLLNDPAFADLLWKIVMQQTVGGFLSLSPTDFGNALLAAGVPAGAVNMKLLQDPNGPFTADPSNTFRIRSTGKAGDVAAAIDAVVRLDPPQNQAVAAAVAAPGRLVHWREE